jgi:hypothetical protein
VADLAVTLIGVLRLLQQVVGDVGVNLLAAVGAPQRTQPMFCVGIDATRRLRHHFVERHYDRFSNAFVVLAFREMFLKGRLAQRARASELGDLATQIRMVAGLER